MAMTKEKALSGNPTATGRAIRSLRVMSSGWAEQHQEHRYGTAMPRLWWVLTSRSWVKVPINYFLIDHRDGPILFDTGLDPAIATDRRYISSPIGQFLVRRIFRLNITEEDCLDKMLAANGLAAKDIRTAVFSHLHFDHVGGIAHIPQAKLYRQRARMGAIVRTAPGTRMDSSGAYPDPARKLATLRISTDG